MQLSSTRNAWEQPLAELGFARSRRGEGYRFNGTLFTREGDWATLRTVAPLSASDPLRCQLGKPGLWKMVGGVGGKAVQRVFDVPPLPMETEDEAEAMSNFRACLSWALRTETGEPPRDWHPPSRAEVEAWIPQGSLTIRSGTHVRQVALEYGPDRLALTCPLLTAVPDQLSAARRGWLNELFCDGQDRWRMVRIGWVGEAGVTAEVDLSGAPAGLMECVFRAGLDALRWVVQWLAQSAAFLADAAQACRAVEVCPVRV